ncbi:MAG: hypothetical protein M1833_004343 [Piccolia ochrophora]|nr:MAG: hypothetical protein M1833_004343 [Piccolia ochrophora]
MEVDLEKAEQDAPTLLFTTRDEETATSNPHKEFAKTSSKYHHRNESGHVSQRSQGSPKVIARRTLHRFRRWAKGKPQRRRAPNHHQQSIVRKLEDSPVGYPQLATFLDSDDNFMIYRRFGYLYSRILMQKQDELRELEESIDIRDQQDNTGLKRDMICLKSRAHDVARRNATGIETRQEILHKTERKLYDYGQLLLQAQQMVAMNRPGARDYRSVQNFMAKKRPLLEADADFVYRKEDLVTLRPGRESAWLDAFVERILILFSCGPIQETRQKSNDPDLRYFTKSRVDCLVALLITVIILVLLVIPIYALCRLNTRIDTQFPDAVYIGVLLVSTLVFSAVLSFFTKAKRHEILGASAA